MIVTYWSIDRYFCVQCAMANRETEEQTLVDSSARRDPRTLTTLSDIISCLSVLQSEEAEVSNALTDLLDAREPILASLTRLTSLAPELDGLQAEARMFSEKVLRTATTADLIGSKVRSLDEEMSRVKEAGDRVSQVIELKVFLLQPSASAAFDSVPVLSICPPCLHRKPRLGSSHTELLESNGSTPGYHFRSIRWTDSRKQLNPLFCLYLIQ